MAGVSADPAMDKPPHTAERVQRKAQKKLLKLQEAQGDAHTDGRKSKKRKAQDAPNSGDVTTASNARTARETLVDIQ